MSQTTPIYNGILVYLYSFGVHIFLFYYIYIYYPKKNQSDHEFFIFTGEKNSYLLTHQLNETIFIGGFTHAYSIN